MARLAHFIPYGDIFKKTLISTRLMKLKLTIKTPVERSLKKFYLLSPMVDFGGLEPKDTNA